MRFLADMGISPRVLEDLRQRNHDAVHLAEKGRNRMTDGEILQKAYQENRVLLTHDLDFGELLAASGGNLPSVKGQYAASLKRVARQRLSSIHKTL